MAPDDLRARMPDAALALLDGRDGRYSEWATACAIATHAMNVGLNEDEFVSVTTASDFSYEFASENGRDRSDRLESRLRKVWAKVEEVWQPPLGSVENVRGKLAALSQRLADHQWGGSTRGTDRAVALALVTRAHELGVWTVDASAREVSLLAVVNRNTANKAMHRLVTVGVLRPGAGDREGTHSQRWVLNLDWGITGQKRTHDSVYGGKGLCVPIRPVIDHPAFHRSALGKTGQRVWLDLMDHPQATAAEIAARLGFKDAGAVRRALAKLTAHGLVAQGGTKGHRRPAATYEIDPSGSLDSVAESFGLADWHERTTERYGRERSGYREVRNQRRPTRPAGPERDARREDEDRLLREQAGIDC